MSKLGPYKVHPIAELFPLLEGEEFIKLVESIRRDGLQDPIILSNDEELLIDGRNRYLACLKAHIDPVFTRLAKNYDELKTRDYIINANLHRRHLNPGQLAIVAAKLLPSYEAEAKERMRAGGGDKKLNLEARTGSPKSGYPIGQARDQVAAIIGVGASTISRAKKVAEIAPQLESKVMAGEISLNEAYNGPWLHAPPSTSNRANGPSFSSNQTRVAARSRMETARTSRLPRPLR